MSNEPIIFNPPDQSSTKSQIDNLQTTLATINQQMIFLQEAVAEKDQQIKNLSQASPKVENKSTKSLYFALATAIVIDFLLSGMIIFLGSR